MRNVALLSFVALAFAVPSAQAQDSFGQPAPPSPPPNQPAPPSGSPYGPPPPPNAPRPGPGAEQQMQAERQDFGVAATAQLHSGPMHAPTPSSIPGGQVITTPGLVALLQGNQVRAFVFDILGGPEVIPGALPAVPAAQAGSFSDRTQQEFGQFLNQTTQGNKETPLVFYCLSSHCWMSYNASLRAINMGYKNVLWYRGGIEAWKAAGQQVQAAAGGR